jgi:hypothetical protein
VLRRGTDQIKLKGLDELLADLGGGGHGRHSDGPMDGASL